MGEIRLAYKSKFKENYGIPSYLRFTGEKFKPYEKLLYSFVIDFYLTQLLGSNKNKIKLRVVPKSSIMKGSFANVVLDRKAINNNEFTLNIISTASYKIMLSYLAHELTHVKQIFKKELSTVDFKTLQWKGEDIVSDKEYSKLRQKDIDAYFNLPHEAEAEKNYKILPKRLFDNGGLFKLKGIDPTLDFIIDTLK